VNEKRLSHGPVRVELSPDGALAPTHGSKMANVMDRSAKTVQIRPEVHCQRACFTIALALFPRHSLHAEFSRTSTGG
jgi:hypothetical protein